MLEILKDDNEILRTVCEPIKRIDRKVLDLASDMLVTMYKANGAGLAAPQVGVSQRLVVIDVGDGPMTLINPVVTKAEGEMNGGEGCLSFPNLYGNVVRSEKVEVTALNRNGRQITVTGTGLLARALQHEIDHLDGILFVDKATDLKYEEDEEEEQDDQE